MDGMQIDDYYELLSLHKVILEAKFHPDPLNLDIAGSPFVARLAERTLAALVDAETKRGKPEKAAGWYEWAAVRQGDDYWTRAIQHAVGFRDWAGSSHQEKVQLAIDVLAPFRASDDDLQKFVDDVNAKII